MIASTAGPAPERKQLQAPALSAAYQAGRVYEDLHSGQNDLGFRILIELLFIGSLYIKLDAKLPIQPPMITNNKLVKNNSI